MILEFIIRRLISIWRKVDGIVARRGKGFVSGSQGSGYEQRANKLENWHTQIQFMI